MSKKSLHITNGSSLTEYLNESNITGEFLTWHEMLSEGPTTKFIGSDEFLDARKSFLNEFYDIEIDEYEYKNELHKLNDVSEYSEIILWFEYDLFCHINLLAVINLIQQKNIKHPVYLVCSGRIEGEKNLKSLPELSSEQLLTHYKEKVKLTLKDIQLAITLWDIYCGKDHNLFKPFIVKSSNFKYLNNCLKAHLERFPDSKSGLNILERNILEIIRDNVIKSRHHLLGYALNYQGYYGFGDLQLERIINTLETFFTEKENKLSLNRKGFEALLGQYSFLTELMSNMTYGGVSKFDFQFNKKQNKLIKTVINAN